MTAVSWEALPDEVIALIARLLLGFELLRLSHVNSHLLHVFSRPEMYTPRHSHLCYQQEKQHIRLNGVDSKRNYTQAGSFQFTGGQSDSHRHPRSYAPISWSTDTFFGFNVDGRAQSFTLDAWFSLSPPQNGIVPGGILLGLQSEKCREDGGQWPEFQRQVLHVDIKRNLYCSVTGEKSCVAAELELRRWYHVALVFEDHIEYVYLNGEMVSEKHSERQQLESFPFYYAQIGTGYIGDDSVGKPAESCHGWYTFHGVVDDLRIWNEAMSPEQIDTLSRDCGVVQRHPTFSFKRDVPVWMAYGVKMVRCSQPREGWCDIVAVCKCASDRESWV